MDSSRRKASIKKGTVIKLVVALAVVAVAVFVLVRVLQARVSEQYGGQDEKAVQSAQVTTGSITTTVSGSGTLANEESEDTFISSTVDVTEVYVEAGDTVKAGDMLASVDSASVVKAMKEVQDDIDAIDEKISALEEEDVSSTIAAGVDGRVKKIYASAGDSVADVMYDNGSLMLLSADGYLAVDVETDALSKGDVVSVSTEDGSSLEGSVDAVWAGRATVLVADESAEVGAKATVSKDGADAGSGTLYIHEEVAVTGFTGTVDSVSVSEGASVAAGDTLLYISDASSTVSYATLLEQREDLEDQLQDLIVVHKEGAVYAQANGMVTAISETEDSTTTTTQARSSSGKSSSSSGSGSSSGTSASASGSEQSTVTTVATNSGKEDGTTISICPTDSMTVALSVDETDILALEVGQEAQVSISSLGDDTYQATVTDLDTVGTSSDGVTTYTATLTLERTDGMLDGMSASALIVIEGKDDALLVPVEAVNQTSSTSFVYTSYDEETDELGDMVEVVAGLSNGEYTEISTGLSAGDTVYYSESEDTDERRPGGMGAGGMGSMGGMGGMGAMGGNGGPGGDRSGGSGRPSGSRSGGSGGSGGSRPSGDRG